MHTRLVTSLFVFIASLGVAAQAPAHTHTFEVISIRPAAEGPQRMGPTQDGYQLRGLYMIVPILTAYPPSYNDRMLYKSKDQQINFPDWVSTEPFDMDAKVSDADLADWHDPAKQSQMMREMLQAMLADRLKFQVHREKREGNVYEMVVAKGGPKFKPADTSTPHPGRINLPDGSTVAPERTQCGIITHYWNITMPMVAAFVFTDADRPIIDKTGLAGHYDLQREIPTGNCSLEGSAQQAQPSVYSIAGDLGLKLQPAKGPVEVLVMDHVEEPTKN